MLAAATGAPAPNTAGYDPAVRALFTEANAVVPLVDAVAQAGVADLANITRLPALGAAGQRYDMVYEAPPNNANEVTWHIIHELIHASGAEHYTGPANLPVGRQFDAADWSMNMHLPAGAANVDFDAQVQTLTDNIADALDVVDHDPNLTAGDVRHLSTGIQARLPYGGYLARREYDAVVADSLLYLQQRGRTNTASFRFLRRLANEAADRRQVAPWWGTKTARRVNRNAAWYQFWEW